MASLAPMWYQDPALGLDMFRGGSPYHASPSGGAGGMPSYASPFPAPSPSHPVMMPSSAHYGTVSRAPLQPLPRAPSPISNLQPGRSMSPPTPLHHRNQPQFFGVSASSSSPYTFSSNSRLHQHTSSSSFMCSPMMMLKSSNNITASAENEPPQQQQQQPHQPLNMCSPLAVSVAASPFSSATEFSLFSSPPTRLLKTPLPHYSTPSSFSYFHLPFLCTGSDEQPKRLSLPSPIGSPPSSGRAVDSSPTSSLFHFDMSWGALDQTSCCSTSSSVKSSTDSTPTSSQEPSPVSSQSPSPSLSPLSSPPCSRSSSPPSFFFASTPMPIPPRSSSATFVSDAAAHHYNNATYSSPFVGGSMSSWEEAHLEAARLDYSLHASASVASSARSSYSSSPTFSSSCGWEDDQRAMSDRSFSSHYDGSSPQDSGRCAVVDTSEQESLYSSSAESNANNTASTPTTNNNKANGQHNDWDNPRDKQQFKEFVATFKQVEKESGSQKAALFAAQQLLSGAVPSSLHWRVCLELAEVFKRDNMPHQAALCYERAVYLRPGASQPWLEYAKLLEEMGELDRCREVLLWGVHHCPYSESLVVKSIKHEERLGNIENARALLGRLKHFCIQRTWKTVMEGALMEARVGNLQVARRIFKYLIKHVPWYGPIFNEAFRFEERYEQRPLRAVALVEQGLKENPRYGPLWFSGLRIYERLCLDATFSPSSSSASDSLLRQTVFRALNAVPKELVWKIYFEAAQIEERAGNIEQSRNAFKLSALNCPPNLIWKVWIGGARMELAIGNLATARRLLRRGLCMAPRKMRATVLLECSRLEEFAGEKDVARRILRKAKVETKHEWRVFLEAVLLEIRDNNLEAALKEARDALSIHTGTGRLWAVLIHLYRLKGQPRKQVEVFKEALQEVPKSGEVWCEGARIALARGKLRDARIFLDFAIQFTPQYGDSFVEYLRLELMENGPEADLWSLQQACINADPNYGFLWLHCKKGVLDSAREVLDQAKDLLLGLPKERLPTALLSLPLLDDTVVVASDVPAITSSAAEEERKRTEQETTAAARWAAIFGGDPLKP
ncbi:Tetratricopeptide repeat domain containing protein [Balamuthia mandrillaris]